MSNLQQKQKGFSYEFKQQILKAWQPIPTLNKTILLFMLIGIIFLTVGIILQVFTQQVLEYRFRYDNICSQKNCNHTLFINQQMKGPIFVYYQLSNFYQNHRLYVKSYSQTQLSGQDLTLNQISTDCDPIIKNSDLYIKKSLSNTTLDPNGPANPCGLIAYTVFNDSFSIINQNNTEATILSNGIAWPSDLKRYNLGNLSQMWYNTTDQRFMIWMRIAALSNFRKPWGRIEDNLLMGNYTIMIQNNYNLNLMNVERYFVLSQTNEFGSKDYFLSISYLTFGCLCIAIAVVFLIKKVHNTRTQRKFI